MPLSLPQLETDRLIIRDFRAEDLDDVHRILDGEVEMPHKISREERCVWLEWTIAGYKQYAALYQPPYGERAIILKAIGELIGVAGFTPMFHPYGEMAAGTKLADARLLPEIGLYYSLSPRHQRQGYATEAAKALLDYGFDQLNLKRIVANTDFDNAASIGVMEKIGMTIVKNDDAGPDWFQVLGVLEE